MANTGHAFSVLELNHIALYVRDLEVSTRFYRDVLGLPTLPRPDFGFGGAWFALGSQQLHLIAADPARLAQGHAFHFGLQVPDAHAAYAALREKGILDLQDPAPRPDGTVSFFLNDPDGSLIELLSYPSDEL